MPTRRVPSPGASSSAAMFSFDHSALPQLTTRKALVIVDFQQDFLSPDGPLPVVEPEGFVWRTVDLASAFRSSDVVVWARSEFEAPRPHGPDHIILDDSPPSPSRAESRRGRHLAGRTTAANLELKDPLAAPDPEAFLSHTTPFCAKRETEGCEMPEAIAKTLEKGDLHVTKSHYSAFEGTRLLMMLRSKMVTEVFVCGSLANVGVHATALEAAGHGMAITIVEDCCGYRSEARQRRAVKNLMEVTGCEVASCDEVLETMRVAVSSSTKSSMPPPPAPKAAPTGRSSQTPDLAPPLAGLRLTSSSASPAPTAPEKSEDEGESGKHGMKTGEDPPTANKAVKHDQAGGSQPIKKTKARADEAPQDDHESTSEDEDAAKPLKGICDGDTDIIHNLLPPSIADGVFNTLREEIEWKRMSHQGGEVPRLVAVQGEVAEDGSIPIYRHPSDESPSLLPFSPTVRKIQAEVEKHLGHPLNHVLIQFYRDGMDYISEHSDKTLDIVQTSYIANVSLGAERTMVLRTKRKDKDPSRTDTSATDTKRQIQRARLPHNSLCRMGLQTNMKWLHAIRQDKRAEKDKSASELAYKGGRISLTFRRIGTFLNKDETRIWGQGATGKTQKEAKDVINGQTPEAVKMLRAFGTENHSSVFDWTTHYGEGFDVLHIRTASRLFTSGDAIVNNRVGLMLAESGIAWAKGSMGPVPDEDTEAHAVSEAMNIKFIDNDDTRSTIHGELAILLYLDWCRTQKAEAGVPTRTSVAQGYQLFQQGLALREQWQKVNAVAHSGSTAGLKSFVTKDLKPFETRLESGEDEYLTGSTPSLPDFAVWPVLHDMVTSHDAEILEKTPALRDYYDRLKRREAAQKLLGRDAGRS